MTNDTCVGYVTGYKVLDWSSDYGNLESPVAYTDWDSPIMEARCHGVPCWHEADENGSRICPGGKGGTCGIYAGRTPRKVWKYSGKKSVLTYVRGYGRVTEGDEAWRAEKAEIVAIYKRWSPFDSARTLAKTLWLDLAVGLGMDGLFCGLGHHFVGWLFSLLTGIIGIYLLAGIRHLKPERYPLVDEFRGVPVFHSARQFAKFIGQPRQAWNIRLYRTFGCR